MPKIPIIAMGSIGAVGKYPLDDGCVFFTKGVDDLLLVELIRIIRPSVPIKCVLRFASVNHVHLQGKASAIALYATAAALESSFSGCAFA